MTVNWGFLGAGYVASRGLAPAVHASLGANLYAVASRDEQRSATLEPERVHATYEDLLADEHVDAVYISLSNSQHLEWVTKSLEAGKHVLCEKPLGLNATETEAMFDCASRSGRLLVEAVWGRWHPRFSRMVEVVASGAIGNIEHIEFEFRGEPQASYLIRAFKGFLWVGTNKGLVQLKLGEKNPHRKLYTSTMGLVNDELNKGSIFIDSDNYFWLGTVNGLTRFKPEFKQEKRNRIPLYFEEIQVTGKVIEARKEIDLPFKDNYFSISFAALSYIDASTIQYKYRL